MFRLDGASIASARGLGYWSSVFRPGDAGAWGTWGGVRLRGVELSAYSRSIVVQEDTCIEGRIINADKIEIYGRVAGDLAADAVLIHPSGKCKGTVRALDADVHGTLEGRIFVKNRMRIHSKGSVLGNLEYGRLTMEDGANLSADVRNVPPEIRGDLKVEVGKGRSVSITNNDLTGFDPDDSAEALIYSVLGSQNGYIKLAGGNGPARTFTQSDLDNGRVLFVHDGSAGRLASFEVMLTDGKGATSGSSRTVEVAVGAG